MLPEFVCWQLDLTSISKPPGSRHTFPRVDHKIWKGALSIALLKIFGLTKIFDLLKELDLPDFVFSYFLLEGEQRAFLFIESFFFLLKIFLCV